MEIAANNVVHLKGLEGIANAAKQAGSKTLPVPVLLPPLVRRGQRTQRRRKNKMEVANNGGETLRGRHSSLKVPNVQALAAAAGVVSGEVLQRYTRPEIKEEPVRDAGCSDDIPVLDLGRLLDPQLSQEEASKLHSACEEWGFFQLVNHGISDELIEKMKVVIQEFFQLPFSEKEEFAQGPDSLEGYGQAFVVSEDQKLDWGDMLHLWTQPPSLRSFKFWPTHPPTFRDTLEMYSVEVRTVAHSLFELIAKNLGTDPKEFVDMFEFQAVRINYYPPCPQADKVLGLSPHSDAVGITLLLQINQVLGLQIKKKDAWVPIKPLPGAFVVNIGDILEVFSNGKYKSIEHRVVINPEKERLSIAGFHSIKHSAMVGPLPEIVKGGEEYYKTMSFESFMKLHFSSKLDGKNLIDRVKLKT